MIQHLTTKMQRFGVQSIGAGLALITYLLVWPGLVLGGVLAVSDVDGDIAGASTNGVVFLDSQTGNVLAKKYLTQPAGISLDAGNRRAYVIDGAFVKTISLDTFLETRAPVEIGNGYQGALSGLNDQTNRLYVGSYYGPFSVVDTQNNTLVSVQNLGTSYFVTVAKDLNKIYTQLNSPIIEVDGATNTVTRTLDVGSCCNSMDYSASTKKLFVAAYFDDQVHVVNLLTGATSTVVLGRSPIDGNSPNGLAYDSTANRVIVSAAGGGLFAIDATTEQVVAAVQAPDVLTQIRIDPIGRRIFGTSGSVVRVFDADTLAPLQTIGGFNRAVFLDVLPGTNAYAFTGFFPPVSSLPVTNIAKAGSAIPVKFSLGGDQGLDIFAQNYPGSAQVACDTLEIPSIVQEVVSAGGSALNYDPATGQYVYAWKTDKSWAGQCRMLVLKFDDGTEHAARFRFR